MFGQSAAGWWPLSRSRLGFAVCSSVSSACVPFQPVPLLLRVLPISTSACIPGNPQAQRCAVISPTGSLFTRLCGLARCGLPSCSFFFFLIFKFFYFWLRWVFFAVRGLSLVAASGGYSSLRCVGFSLRWLLLLRSTGSRRMGFSSCGAWAQ